MFTIYIWKWLILTLILMDTMQKTQLVKNPPIVQENWVQSLSEWGSPGEGNGYPLQYSCMENPMDCIVHGVAKSGTRPGNFHFFMQK